MKRSHVLIVILSFFFVIDTIIAQNPPDPGGGSGGSVGGGAPVGEGLLALLAMGWGYAGYKWFRFRKKIMN